MPPLRIAIPPSTRGGPTVLRMVVCVAALATAAACGAPTGAPSAPEPVDSIRAGYPDTCANETPTTPLPPDAYPPLTGMGPVTDVGRITAVADGPVLVWDRIAFHVCSKAELDEAHRRSEGARRAGGCLDGYELRDESHALRRYRVAADAVLFLRDLDGNLHRAGVDRLSQLTGAPWPILVSANAAGDVAMIGEGYVP